MRWMSNFSHHAHRRAPVDDAFHQWVLSLPWVVERPSPVEPLAPRVFAIACEPLDIRQLWLVSGLGGWRVAVGLPEPITRHYEVAGLGRGIAPMSAEHVLFGVDEHASAIDLERIVLEAYGVALAR